MPFVSTPIVGSPQARSAMRRSACRSVPITAGTGVETSAAKLASILPAASESFLTSRSSRPRMASMSRRPAEKTASLPASQRGSSKPQMLPTQPPASITTEMPPSP